MYIHTYIHMDINIYIYIYTATFVDVRKIGETDSGIYIYAPVALM